MIDPGTARQLVALILRVEERLARLLTSGWRQASSEAADLQQEADALSEAGLPTLAARVSAVAAATDASSALHAMALAASACQLFRARLLISEPPDGWQPIRPPTSRGSRRNAPRDTVLPVARLQIDGQEVWACGWPARNQLVLLKPPFPDPPEASQQPADAGGLLSRVQERLRQAMRAVGDDVPSSFWLRDTMQGGLRWEERYPVGVSGEIAVCTLHDAAWQAESDDADQGQLRAFRSALTSAALRDGSALTWSLSALRVMELDRRDAPSYVWLDPTTSAAFHEAASPNVWALALLADNIVVPLAVLQPSERFRKPRIVHLIPGLPSDTLEAPIKV